LVTYWLYVDSRLFTWGNDKLINEQIVDIFNYVLISIFTAVKMGLHKYHKTCFSRSGVNQMWILKNSKDLLETLSSRSQYVCNNIKTFDFSTLYTTIPHILLKSRIKKKWISVASLRRTETKGISIILLVETNLTLSKAIKKSNNKFNQDEIIQMLDF